METQPADTMDRDGRIYLGLVIHNHQPVGNFPSVFARAYEQAYAPMVQALESHPSIRISLHYSGPLLDWLKVNQPGFLGRVADLVRRGQVEIVGGGYYEPILPDIPESDRQGQIMKMADFCAGAFGSTPTGLWLAERVWEPSLPVPLARTGVSWTVVDDTHFKMVGLDEDDLFGYYITEDQGYPTKVFASSKFLRYSVPFRTVEEVMAYLKRHASKTEARIAVMGDDGEKFGVWPQTFEHCWGENGWIEQFFAAIEKSSSWLTTVPAGQFAGKFPALGRIYLPCASYDEMMEWALPPSRSREFAAIKHRMEAEGRHDVSGFMNGGFWRHFAVKYPEVNWMHKKMLRVHRKVERARVETGTAAGQDELWQAQCNCPYWHGVFGGLYLADIRAATYQHLIAAESQADAALQPLRPWLNWETTDIDHDGNDELLLDGSSFELGFRPAQGGSLIEWDLHSPDFNVLSSLARRPEAYHKELAEAIARQGPGQGTETIHAGIRLKDARVARLLAYDRLPRFSLLDHFLGSEVDLNRFASVDYEELGDFTLAPYQVDILTRGPGTSVRLFRHGKVKQRGEEIPITLEKTLAVVAGQKRLPIAYELRNDSAQPVSGILAVEWNINLLGGGHNDQAYYESPGAVMDDAHLDSTGVLPSVAGLALGNRYLGIRLELSLDPACEVWRFPVETVSNSEAGVEGLYQASCLVIRMAFSLQPEQKTGLRMDWQQVDR
ncbi:MAG: DUF1926 domain-containing protein [Chloroflexi bacterium]|nr:DUF1926 domain-containing protein [Chloroflexota bacterium]